MQLVSGALNCPDDPSNAPGSCSASQGTTPRVVLALGRSMGRHIKRVPVSFDPEVSDDDLEKAATITFDLLIRQAATTAPVVTSWGEPGSGPKLEDYSAALPTTVSTENGPDTPLEAPAPSVTPAAERSAAPSTEDTE